MKPHDDFRIAASVGHALQRPQRGTDSGPVPGGVHIFNFRQQDQAAIAWDATVQWFDRYLRPVSAAPLDPAMLTQ